MPGESKVVTLSLIKTMTSEETGTYTNIAEIAEDYNNGKVTVKETYKQIYYRFNRTTMNHQINREIIPVNGDVKPYEYVEEIIDGGERYRL